MSGLFDDLARSLVGPMPRRRVLRLLGGAVAVAAVPGLRARPARAHSLPTCGPTTELCTNGTGSDVCMPLGGTCCIFPDIVVGCRPGFRCGDGRNAPCLCDGEEEDGKCVKCVKARMCKGKCCPKNNRCVKGACCPLKRTTFAPGTNGKGAACCPAGTIAVPGAVGWCCPKGDMDCCAPISFGGDDELVGLRPAPKRGQLCVKGKNQKV
jgi:hypothetical protein